MLYFFLLTAFVLAQPPSGGAPPSDGGAPPDDSGSSSSGGQNFHVTFGDNCEGSTYSMDMDVFVNSWYQPSGSETFNEYSEYWEAYGTDAAVADGYCDTDTYLDGVYANSDSPYTYIGPVATTSGSVEVYGYPNHDTENYCSAEGTVTPPLMGSDFSTSSYTFTTTPSNQYVDDISNNVGVAVNGVIVFSPYTGVNTVAPEDETLDVCSGHPANGNYHYHGYPPCLAEALGDSPTGSSDATHSSILGWAWDGFPIYGPWGYTDPLDSSSAIKNVLSSYTCTADDCTDYENWSYDESNGDLDECNGRYGVTPEFPDGMYYYVFSVKDSDGSVQFPGVPYCTGETGSQDTCEDTVETTTTTTTTTTTATPTIMPTAMATTTAAASSGCDCSCYGTNFQVQDQRRSQVCSNGRLQFDCCSSEEVSELSMAEYAFSPQSVAMQGLAGVGLITVIYGCVTLATRKRGTYTQIEFAEQSV